MGAWARGQSVTTSREAGTRVNWDEIDEMIWVDGISIHDRGCM